MTQRPVREEVLPLWALAAFGFVLAAVLLEMLTGAAANSPVPAWADGLVPLSWPPWARVLWWLAVAGAALAYRLAERRAGIRRRLLTVALTPLPFAVFAVGIALGAQWATWH